MAAASSPSAPLLGSIQNQDDRSHNPPPPPPPKKKRNLPGNPNPDAEVIALSPKTLLATNRFICEVCGKGFQREQNLQLHRRGHNLPWKLKQKNPMKARRRVYLCPEPSCVHHDPARALGDLTGIKKHFCRKHGEKKWKCDKCSKKYAVQSDWKAHSKTCGTREYRCDCGTLFSRRDSFITHRAFCDALAQESARAPTAGGMSSFGSQLYGGCSINLGLPPVNSPALASLQNQPLNSSDLLLLGASVAGAPAFSHLTSSSFQSPFYLAAGGDSNQNFGGFIHDLQTNANGATASSAVAAGNLFNLGFFSAARGASALGGIDSASGGQYLLPDQFGNANGGNVPAAMSTLLAGNAMSSSIAMNSMSSLLAAAASSSAANESAAPPQMSATALLQKAAQMGATSSGCAANLTTLLTTFSNTYSSPAAAAKLSSALHDDFKPAANGSRTQAAENQSHFQTLINSLANGSAGGMFGGGNEILREMDDERKLHLDLSAAAAAGAGGDRLTRDFLGGGGVVRRTQTGGCVGVVGASMGGAPDSETKVSCCISLPFGEGSNLRPIRKP